MKTKIAFLSVRGLTQKEFQQKLDDAAEHINAMDGSVLWTDMPSPNHIVITYQYDEDDHQDAGKTHIGLGWN